MGLSARPWRPGSSLWRSSAAQLVESACELGAKQAEVAFDALGPADHHMVRAGNAFGWHDLARERTKAPLHSVADNGAADLLGDGQPDTHRGTLVLTVANEEYKAGRGRALAGVRRDEVGALLERD